MGLYAFATPLIVGRDTTRQWRGRAVKRRFQSIQGRPRWQLEFPGYSTPGGRGLAEGVNGEQHLQQERRTDCTGGAPGLHSGGASSKRHADYLMDGVHLAADRPLPVDPDLGFGMRTNQRDSACAGPGEASA